MAKQLDPAVQSNSFESSDWEMQLHAILLEPQFSSNEEWNIYWQWQLIFQETDIALFKYKRPNDTPPNVNEKNGSENVFLWMRENYRVTRCEFHASVIPSLLNVNKIFM